MLTRRGAGGSSGLAEAWRNGEVFPVWPGAIGRRKVLLYSLASFYAVDGSKSLENNSLWKFELHVL